MPLIKNGLIVADPWSAPSDDSQIPATGPVLVSLARWRGERAGLLRRGGPLGVRLSGAEPPALIADDLDRIALVALEFPSFRDGRAYSYARLLRERYRFRGEVRAVGNLLRDQFLFLHRCGFDAVEVADAKEAAAWAEALREISVAYQPASDRRPMLVALRHQVRAPAFGSVGGARDADWAARTARRLAARYQDQDGLALLAAMIERELEGRIALVSSFGSAAAVLLDMVSRIDRATPVLFLNTGKLFGETLKYRDHLVARLGLSNVREIRPEPAQLKRQDPDGTLRLRRPELCCHVRKIEPLARALEGFDAWITGRKRFHGNGRLLLEPVEAVDGRVKVNPLAHWSQADVAAYYAVRDLPRHPLEVDGFLSIGCMPCTDRVAPGEGMRAGRWRGLEKDECGIHLPRRIWATGAGC